LKFCKIEANEIKSDFDFSLSLILFLLAFISFISFSFIFFFRFHSYFLSILRVFYSLPCLFNSLFLAR
jgi:hypothetical protein